jgi:hypothetical protein
MRNIFAFVLVLVAMFYAGHHQAYLEQQEEINRIVAERAIEAAKAAEQLYKDKEDAQHKINQLRADVATGAVRLSIRSSCSASVAAGDSEARAELDTKTADDLIAITADGDQAIIELNSCIDLYNKFTK